MYLTAHTVESVSALEEEGHGVVLERSGTSAMHGYQRFLLEARFDLYALAAQIMVAAARSLPHRRPAARTLVSLPLATLWGEFAPRAEQEWM